MLERDAENSWLNLDLEDDDCLPQLQGHSVTYRIALGPNQERKVFEMRGQEGKTPLGSTTF